jgi:hypothetical protein
LFREWNEGWGGGEEKRGNTATVKEIEGEKTAKYMHKYDRRRCYRLLLSRGNDHPPISFPYRQQKEEERRDHENVKSQNF